MCYRRTFNILGAEPLDALSKHQRVREIVLVTSDVWSKACSLRHMYWPQTALLLAPDKIYAGTL